MIRPQTKRQKQKELMRDSLKKGDKIVTIGGIHGTIQGFKEKNTLVLIKIDNNTNITVNKTAVTGLVGQVQDSEFQQS